MNATVEHDSDTSLVDIATMRETANLLLGPDDGPQALPPAPKELDTLTSMLRCHLELLIPEVKKKAGRLPKDSIPRYCAIACVGEARRKLAAGPSPRYGGDVGHARRRLARVLRALCDHYENAGKTSP